MIAVAGQAMPLFWLGIMLIIILAVQLRVLPASGYGTWQHFVMPSFCLGAFLAPVTMRLVRSGIIEVMSMEYIKTARAKGVGEQIVVAKHAFRNACIPVITVLGIQFGQLLGGAIITETVFAWPGVATPHRGVDPEPGLSGGAVRGGPAGPHHRGGQSPGGPHRGRHRPAHPGGLMSSTELTLKQASSSTAANPGTARASWRRLWRLKWGLGAALVMAVIVAVTILAPWVAPHDPIAVNIRHRLAPPAWMARGTVDHPLGTDQVGRDLLSRVIYGGRVSLVVGVAAVLISASLGVLLGLAAGLLRGIRGLDDHDARQRHADVSLRAPRPRRHRRARTELAEHDHRTRAWRTGLSTPGSFGRRPSRSASGTSWWRGGLSA